MHLNFLSTVFFLKIKLVKQYKANILFYFIFIILNLKRSFLCFFIYLYKILEILGKTVIIAFLFRATQSQVSLFNFVFNRFLSFVLALDFTHSQFFRSFLFSLFNRYVICSIFFAALFFFHSASASSACSSYPIDFVFPGFFCS